MGESAFLFVQLKPIHKSLRKPKRLRKQLWQWYRNTQLTPTNSLDHRESFLTSAAATPSPASAMLRLRSPILTKTLASSAAAYPNNSSLHRLLFATAAPPISPEPSFHVLGYLEDTCGLGRTKAAFKAYWKLSHLKSPSKPDAVRAFLADLGLSRYHIAAAIAKDPQLLCASVDKTLAPNVQGLSGLGLSRLDIAHLLSLSHKQFRSKTIVPKMQHYLPLFGPPENLLRRVFRFSAYLLTTDIDKAVKPNTVFQRECGLSDDEIAELGIHVRMLTANPDRVRAVVACAEGLGVPRGSAMFAQALRAIGFRTQEKLAARVEFLKNTFTWSDADVRIAICTCSTVLSSPKEFLQRRADYLISEVGLEPAYVARNLNLIGLSLREGWFIPRYYVIKFLKENGLLDRKWSDDTALIGCDEVFKEKFIHPHKEAAPHLAEDYAAACKWKVPARFKNLP